jgi:hypothetical protein
MAFELGHSKVGGRQKGTPNRARKIGNDKIRRLAAEADLMPLDYMLAIMRDESIDYKTRCDMAAKAAPFCHPKLSALLVPEDKPLALENARSRQEVFDAILERGGPKALELFKEFVVRFDQLHGYDGG